MTAATLEAANEAMRAAVRERLDNTPAEDPKVATVSCCEGQRMRGDSLLGRTVVLPAGLRMKQIGGPAGSAE